MPPSQPEPELEPQPQPAMAPAPESDAGAKSGSSSSKKKKNNKKKKKKTAKLLSIFEHLQVSKNPPLSRALVQALEAAGSGESPADPLSARVNGEKKRPFAFRLVDLGDGVGRRAVAARDVAEGELLLQELPFVWTLFRQQLGETCSFCAREISQPVRQNLACDTCRRVCYCSPACQKAEAARHSLLCPVLVRLPGLAQSFDVAEEMLALSAEFLAELLVPGPERTCEAPWFRASLADVQAMTAHEMAPDVELAAGALAKELCKLIAEAFRDLQAKRGQAQGSSASASVSTPAGGSSAGDSPQQQEQRLPDLDPAMVQRFMRVINDNSHELTPPPLGGPRNTGGYGIGVFPLGAIFNHSCQPNATYAAANSADRLNWVSPSEPGPKPKTPAPAPAVAAGAREQPSKKQPLPPQLCFRALRPCKRGEELAVSYVDLYTSRSARAQELWKSKHFVCRCDRCALRPRTEAELQQFLHDRLTGGVLCPTCNADGQHQPDAVMVEARAAEDQSAALVRSGLIRAHEPVPDSLLPVPVMGNPGGEEDAEDDEKKSEDAPEEALEPGAAAAKPAAAALAAAKLVQYVCAKCGREATEATLERLAQAQELAERANQLYWEAIQSSRGGGGHGHSHGGKPCGGHGPEAAAPQPEAPSGGHGHSHGGKPCGGHGPAAAAPKAPEAADGGHGHSHGGKPCGGHGHGHEDRPMTPELGLKLVANIMDQLQSIVHPDHEIVYHLLHPLANLAGKAGDIKLRQDTVKRLIDTSSRQWPANFLPLAQMYLAAANITRESMKHRMAASRMVPKTILLRMREERLEYLQKASRIMEVCRGADDPASVALRSLLEEAKRDRV